MSRSRDGTVLHQVALDISLTVGPLQSDAVVGLGHGLQVPGGIQGYGKYIYKHIIKDKTHWIYYFSSTYYHTPTCGECGGDGVTGGVSTLGDERHSVLCVRLQAVNAVLLVWGENVHAGFVGRV